MILGMLDQVPIYNAINFSWGVVISPPDAPPLMCYRVNSTAINTKIAGFLCPSDGNAGWSNINSYHACIGTTTFAGPGIPKGSDGLFAYLIPYSLASCSDGSASTIAFTEAVVGPPVLSYVPGISLTNVGGIPATAHVFSVYMDPVSVQNALKSCDQSWKVGTATLYNGHGLTWAQGRRGTRCSTASQHQDSASTPGVRAATAMWASRCSTLPTATTRGYPRRVRRRQRPLHQGHDRS